MSDVHIVTVATESKYYFPYLVESCKRHGTELKVLGYGEKWEGFSWRFKKMLDYLKSLPEDDIVCFVDGYDVLCVRDINELKAEFLRIKKEQNCKIIIAEDKNDNVFFKYVASALYDQCQKININAGTYIGKVKDVYSILTEISLKNPGSDNDDQILLTAYCKNNEKKFYIDVKNEMFLTKVNFLQEIDDNLIIKNNEVIVNNKNRPFFLHAPSGYLDNIILKLGLPYDDSNKIKDILFYEFFTTKIWKSTVTKYIIYFAACIFILTFAYFSFKNSKKRGNKKNNIIIHKWIY
jgi:hypothetical protein